MHFIFFLFLFSTLNVSIYDNSKSRSLNKKQKKTTNVLENKKKYLSLHPQLRNDGGIAQLVRAHDS